MGSTWGPPGDDRTQVGHMLAPWTLLSGLKCDSNFIEFVPNLPIETRKHFVATGMAPNQRQAIT